MFATASRNFLKHTEKSRAGGRGGGGGGGGGERAGEEERRRNEIHFSPITESLFYRKQSSRRRRASALRRAAALHSRRISLVNGRFIIIGPPMARPAGPSGADRRLNRVSSGPAWKVRRARISKVSPRSLPFRSDPFRSSIGVAPGHSGARTHLINRRMRYCTRHEIENREAKLLGVHVQRRRATSPRAPSPYEACIIYLYDGRRASV